MAIIMETKLAILRINNWYWEEEAKNIHNAVISRSLKARGKCSVNPPQTS